MVWLQALQSIGQGLVTLGGGLVNGIGGPLASGQVPTLGNTLTLPIVRPTLPSAGGLPTFSLPTVTLPLVRFHICLVSFLLID
jgi:hypothetical protein